MSIRKYLSYFSKKIEFLWRNKKNTNYFGWVKKKKKKKKLSEAVFSRNAYIMGTH